MTVYCSYCSTGYLLPDHLLGPRGARVRCPRCGKTFVVIREFAEAGAGESAPPEPPGRAEPTTPWEAVPAVDPVAMPLPPAIHTAAAAADDPAAAAREVMGALSARLGARLAQAREAGKVLAEFGPDLMSAYDDYRLRVGPGATTVPFKVELRERWGVDLLTGIEG